MSLDRIHEISTSREEQTRVAELTGKMEGIVAAFSVRFSINPLHDWMDSLYDATVVNLLSGLEAQDAQMILKYWDNYSGHMRSVLLKNAGADYSEDGDISGMDDAARFKRERDVLLYMFNITAKLIPHLQELATGRMKRIPEIEELFPSGKVASVSASTAQAAGEVVG